MRELAGGGHVDVRSGATGVHGHHEHHGYEVCSAEALHTISVGEEPQYDNRLPGFLHLRFHLQGASSSPAAFRGSLPRVLNWASPAQENMARVAHMAGQRRTAPDESAPGCVH